MSEVLSTPLTHSDVFLICTYGVLPAWLLLAILPGWSWTDRIVHSVVIPIILGIAYTWFLATGAFTGADAPDGGGFGSLESLMILFTHPTAVLAGWIHYLVFDLFVGAWEVRDARRRQLNHLLVLPALFLTLMAGPMGLLFYLLIRAAFRKGGLSLKEYAA